MYSAVTWPTDARQVVQAERLTARVDRLHVVNVEPVTCNVATGTTPPVASPRCAAHTPPLVRIVGPIRETRAPEPGGLVTGVLAHQRGFHGCSPMETVVTSLTVSMMHRWEATRLPVAVPTLALPRDSRGSWSALPATPAGSAFAVEVEVVRRRSSTADTALTGGWQSPSMVVALRGPRSPLNRAPSPGSCSRRTGGRRSPTTSAVRRRSVERSDPPAGCRASGRRRVRVLAS